jgi:hypothetical protein
MMHRLHLTHQNFDKAALKTLDSPIVPLDSECANNCAKDLHAWLFTHEKWRQGKKHASDRATIDRLISTHVCATDAILVSSNGVSRTVLSEFTDSWLVERNSS